jgi:hypothetical protein
LNEGAVIAAGWGGGGMESKNTAARKHGPLPPLSIYSLYELKEKEAHKLDLQTKLVCCHVETEEHCTMYR